MAITRVRTIPSPFRLLWLVLFVALACQPSLPELQSLGEDGPNNLEILSLEPAGGGTALTADTVIAGQVYQLRMQVRGIQNQGLSGEPIVVSVVTDSFDELVRFPRGDRCVTPVTPAEGQERGICTVIFRLVGPTETFTLKAQAQRAVFVQDEIRIEPQADQGSVRLTIQVPKSGTARWQPGEIDPLLGLAAMPLAMDDDEAAPLTITLTDAFGNPLTGARVVLMDPPEPEQEPDPPPQDAGIADTGASLSDGPEQVPDGAIVDGSSADLGLAPRTDVGGDAAVLDSSSPRDTQVSDGGIDDGNPMDGGLPDPDRGPEAGAVDGGSEAGITDGGPGDDRPKDRVLIAPWDGINGCGSTGEAPARIEGRTDDQGRILFCLLPGQQAGAWQKHILVPDLIKPEALVDDDDGAFTLSGTTRSGAPTQLELVNALEGGLALIRCDPNGFTPPILFRTLSRRDEPVSGASISLVPRGEIEVLSPLLSLTDDEGISRVLIRCPAALPAGAEITAYLIGTEESITVQIRLDVGRIDQIRIRVAEGVNPQDLGSARAGAPIRFLATAIDTDGNPAADSRLVMSVLSFVPGSSLYYRLPSSCPQDLQGGGLAGGTNVDNSSCRTDINGQIAFDLYAEGPSTLLRPTLLTVQALGQNTRAVLPIYVLPGPPERLQLLPGGQIQAALGGAAGQITARVVDEGGNGVAGIGVSFVAGSCNHDPAVQCDSDSACFDPGRCQESGAACRQSSENCQCEGVVATASLCMPGGQPCHGGCNCEPDQSRRCQRSATDAYTLSSEAGVTDASGSVSTWVLSVNDVGSHLLRATALAPLINFAEASEMRIVAGEGIAQQITISRGERRLFNVDGAAQINMGVGTQLDRPLTVRVETEAGGGVANHGVLVALEEGDAEACGRIALEERVTDEQGEIQLGGAGGAEVFAGPQIGPCVWLFRAGLQAARRLRIVQGPGFPFGGGPQMDDGVELVSLQRPPSEWRDPPPIATVVTLEAQDEFGNPNVGNTVWLDGENCWIRNRIQTLDEAGQASWFVAGGPDLNQACVLTPRHAEGEWEQAVPLTIPIIGSITPVIDGLDQRVGDCPRFGSCSWPAHAPHGCAGPCYVRGPHLQLRGNDPRELILRLPEQRILRPPEFSAQASGVCFEEGDDPYRRCSKAQFGDAEQLGDGSWRYTVQRDLPLHWRTVVNRPEFFVSLEASWFKAGRIKALRVVQPDGFTTGPWQRIYGAPPVTWTSHVTHVEALEEEGAGTPVIKGGFRLHLDNDGVQEVVLCGLDDRGGWHGVIDTTEIGQLPASWAPSRSWLSEGENPRFPAASKTGSACSLLDFNEDGRDDLIVPTQTSDQFRLPRLRIFPGQADAPFFGEGVTVTLSQATPNHPVDNLRAQSGPNRLRLCFGALASNDDCGSNGHWTLEAQGNPFVGDPNAAFGLMTHNGLYVHDPVWSKAAQVYFEGIGSVGPGGALTPVLPWARINLAHPGGGHAVYSSQNGLELFTIQGNTLRVFDAHTGALLRQLSPPQNSIFHHLSPDGRLAVSRLPTQLGDGIWVQSLVWRTSDGEVLHLLDGLGRFAPDNQSIVTFPWRYIGCCNQTQTGTTYRFYDLESGELTSSFDHSERITSFDWSGDSQRLVTVRKNTGEVVVYDREGNLLREVPPEPYNGYIKAYQVDVHPLNDSLLVRRECARFDGACSELIPADSDLPLWRAGSQNSFQKFSRDGRFVLRNGDQIRDASTGMMLKNHSMLWGSGHYDPSLLVWRTGVRFRDDYHWDLAVRRLDEVVPLALIPPTYSTRPGKLLEQSEDDGWAPFVHNDQFRLDQPSTWRARCGDGVIQPDERYDFGPPLVGPTDCGAPLMQLCGNGDVDAGEECDPGGDADHPTCGRDCLLSVGSTPEAPLNSCADLGANAIVPRPRWINPNSDDPNDAFEAFCVPYGDGAPWTLAMKINGHNDTFQMDSELWTNDAALNAESPSLSGSTGYKFPAWSRLDVSELLVGMDNPTDSIRWLHAPIGAPPEPEEGEEAIAPGPLSLQALFTGPARSLETEEQAWLHLAGLGSAPGTYCRRVGLNQQANGGRDDTRFRLGAFSSTHRNCASHFRFAVLGGKYIQNEHQGSAGFKEAGQASVPRGAYLLVR